MDINVCLTYYFVKDNWYCVEVPNKSMCSGEDQCVEVVIKHGKCEY